MNQNNKWNTQSWYIYACNVKHYRNKWVLQLILSV